jgi:hypothetical protein
MPNRIPTPGIPAPKVRKSPSANTGNAHLRDLQRESNRVKKLYDPTAVPGFKYGKGTQ